MNDNKLLDIIRYIGYISPRGRDLSNGRLTKLVYLVDWEYVQRNRRQATNIEWYFDHTGPYVNDVILAARQDIENFEVKDTRTDYGNYVVEIIYKGGLPEVDYDLQRIIDEVVSNTESMFWLQLLNHVYKTPPVQQSIKYSYLNLVDFAGE